MMRSITASAPFSVVLMTDPVSGEPPETMGGESLSVGASSVAVGTLAEADGATRFFLGDLGDGPPLGSLVLRWDGSLPTPSGRLAIVSVEDVVLLEAESGGQTHLQIWTNDDSEPDAIWVALGGGGGGRMS